MTDLLYVLQTGVEYTCGENASIRFDGLFPQVISSIIGLTQVVVPILVVFFGLFDLGKAVMSQKEDDIKKNQGLLVKRVIIAVIVFLVIFLVRTAVSLVGGTDSVWWGCFDCFVNGLDKCQMIS